MKSNMSSLTEKLIFFLVFSILFNFATSNTVDECEENIKELFVGYLEPKIDFNIAMTAIKENLITLSFISEKGDNLHDYYKSYANVINSIGDETFSSKHNEVVAYFQQHTTIKDFEKNSKYTKKIEKSFDCLSISFKNPKHTKKNKNSFATKQNDIVGYFKSFIAKFDTDQPNYIASWINERAMSPREFCEYRANFALSEEEDKNTVYDDVLVCIHALIIMLNLKDDEERTAVDKLMNKTATEAFIYCYLNYTYLDFTTRNESLSQASSSSRRSLFQLFMDLDESSRQPLIGIMIKYFSHMLDVSTTIGEHHRQFGRRVFLTVVEYCAKVAYKRSKGHNEQLDSD